LRPMRREAESQRAAMRFLRQRELDDQLNLPLTCSRNGSNELLKCVAGHRLQYSCRQGRSGRACSESSMAMAVV
jgi:hypothetical protein